MRILIREFTLLLLIWSSWLTASPIEIIDLKNRPAEEVVPIIKPMLDSDGAISGSGFQLIIRTSPENLSQIKRLISQIDSVPNQLLISVFQGSQRELDESSQQIHAQYQDGKIHADVGKPGQSSGARIQTRSGGLTVGGSIQSTRTKTSDNPIQQLRILEGSSGYIETGQSIPYFSGRVYRQHGHAIVESATDYKDINTGFYVRPRLNGKRIILEINPYKESQNRSGAGIVNTQSASTTVTGLVGEWMEIGGIENQSRSSGSRIGGRYETRERQSSRLWIKAELVN